jgi:hypothetical protein
MADLKLEMVIELALRGKELPKDASAEMRRMYDAAQQAKTGLDEMSGGLVSAGKNVQMLGGLLVRFLGPVALAALVRSGISEFAKLERAWRSLEHQLQAIGIASQEAMPRIRALLEGIESGGGALRQDTIPAFQKFLGVLGDVNSAMYATKLASDLAEAGFGNVTSNAEQLVQLFQGRARGAAQAFGVALRDANGNAREASEILKELGDRYGGFGDKASDAQTEVSKLSAQMNKLKESVGAVAHPALTVLNLAIEAIGKTMRSIPPTIGLVLQGLADLINLPRLVASRWDWGAAIRETWLRYEDKMRDVWTKGGADLADALEQGRQDAEAAAASAALADAQRRAQTMETEVLRARLSVAKEGSAERLALELEVLEREKAEAIKAAEERGDATSAIEERFRILREGRIAAHEDAVRQIRERATKESEEQALRRARFEQGLEDELLRLRIEQAAEGSQERLKLELEMLERLEKRKLQEAEAAGANTLLVEEIFLEARDALRQQYADQEIARERDLARQRQAHVEQLIGEIARLETENFERGSEERLKREYEEIERRRAQQVQEAERLRTDVELVHKKWDLERLKAQQRNAQERARIEAMMVQQQLQTQIAYASQAVALGQALFGQNKAIAIAQAIVDTWRAATQVLPNWPLAALVIATGLANIARIRSASPGGSGGAAGAATGGGGIPTVTGPAATAGMEGGSQLSAAVAAPSPAPPPPTPVIVQGGSTGPTQVSNDFSDRSERPFIVQGNVYGGDAGLRELRRLIQQAERQDESRRVR